MRTILSVICFSLKLSPFVYFLVYYFSKESDLSSGGWNSDGKCCWEKISREGEINKKDLLM